MTPSEEILSAYLDDELGAQERADVERRLASDAHWRDTLEKLQEVRTWVQELPAVTPSRPKSIVQMLAEQKPDQNDSPVRLGDNANISAAPSSWKWMMSLAATSLLLVGTTLWWVSGVGQPIALGPSLENAAPDSPVPAIRSEGASVQSKSTKTNGPRGSVASASATDPQAEGDAATLIEESTQRQMKDASNADGQSPESIAAGDMYRDPPTPKSMAAQGAPSPLMTGADPAEATPTDSAAAQPLNLEGEGNPPLQAMNAAAAPGDTPGSESELRDLGGIGGMGGFGGNSGFGGAGGMGGALGGEMVGGAPSPLNAEPLVRSPGGAASAEGGRNFAPALAPLENMPGAPAPTDTAAGSRGRSTTMKGAPAASAPAASSTAPSSGAPAPSPAVENAAVENAPPGTGEMVDPKRVESNSDQFALGMQIPARPLARFLSEKDTPSVNSLYFWAQDPTFVDAEPESGTESVENPTPNELLMRKENRGVETGAKAGEVPLQLNRDSTEPAPAGAGIAGVESGASTTSYRFVTDQVIHLTVPTEVFADIEESMAKGELKLQQASSLADSKPASADLNTGEPETIVKSAVNENKLWLLELSPLSYEALRKRWSEKGFDVTEILDDRKLNLVREYGPAGAPEPSGAADAPSPPGSSTDPQSRSDDGNRLNKPPMPGDFIFILLQGR